MINVLMFALEFPPVNSTGCFRYLKFIRHLHEFNISLTVITPTLDDLKRIHHHDVIDLTLLENIPPTVEFIQIPLPQNGIYTAKKITFKSKVKHYLKLGADNLASSWRTNLYLELDQIIRNKSPKCIFVSIPPFSLGKIAVDISKKYRIPLVVDFRDELSLNKSVPFSTYLHFKNAINSENFILKNATAVTVVTPQLINIFKKVHKNLEFNKLSLLTNGFDEEHLNLATFQNSPTDGKKKFIVGYSGEFYYHPKASELNKIPFYKRPGFKKISYKQNYTNEDWSYRSPLYFIKALSELFKRRNDLKAVVEFHYIGHCPSWLYEMINHFGLENNFISYGYVSKKKNLELQKTFNALLSTSEKIIGGDHYCLSSKVFDYVQMQKPILAFVTEGITKVFIQKSGCGIVCDPDNTLSSSQKIENLVEKTISFFPNIEYLEQFHARRLTENLSRVLANSIDNYKSYAK